MKTIVVLLALLAGALVAIFVLKPFSSRPLATASNNESVATKDATIPRRVTHLDIENHNTNEMGSLVRRTVDPELQALVDKQARNRVTADIGARIPSIKASEDLELAVAVLRDASDDDTVRNEIANLLRRSEYKGLTRDLLAVLNNEAEKERFRNFVVQHLFLQIEQAERLEREEIVQALKACLHDRHLEVQREAVLALVRLKDPAGKERTVEWLNDGRPELDEVRDLAIRCAKVLGLKEQIPTIRKYLEHPSATIRIQAMVALSHWGDEESRDRIAAATQSPEAVIKSATLAALERLDSHKNRDAQELSSEVKPLENTRKISDPEF